MVDSKVASVSPLSESGYDYLEASYSGSRIFQPLGDAVGLQIDRVSTTHDYDTSDDRDFSARNPKLLF